MNIFKILSSYDGSINEPNVSSFLAYLLDPNEDHGLSSILIQETLLEIHLKDNNYLDKISLENKISDLSKFSKYTINISPEFTVFLNKNNKRKKRDIDILVEVYENNNLLYGICFENKISDNSIILSDSQLEDEIKGIENYYNENKNAPEIFIIYLTLSPSKKSEESFNKLNYEKKIHLFWKGADGSIYNKINKIFQLEGKGEIDPINDQSIYLLKSFLSFIKTGFKSYVEEKQETNEKRNYGKPVIDHLNDFAKQLLDDKTYTLKELRSNFSEYVEHISKVELHKATRNAHILLGTINDRNRGHYNVKDPFNMRKNIFYYPNINNKKELKLFNINLNKSIDVYYKNIDTGNIDRIESDKLLL